MLLLVGLIGYLDISNYLYVSPFNLYSNYYEEVSGRGVGMIDTLADAEMQTSDFGRWESTFIYLVNESIYEGLLCLSW